MKVLNTFFSFFRKNNRQIMYTIAVASFIGSLSVSEIYGWKPFFLSSLQRVFMYSLVPIIGYYMFSGKENLQKFTIPLTLSGCLVSLYHYLYFQFNTMVGCGFAFPCITKSKIWIFGYDLHPQYLPAAAFISFFIIFLLSLTLESEFHKNL